MNTMEGLSVALNMEVETQGQEGQSGITRREREKRHPVKNPLVTGNPGKLLWHPLSFVRHPSQSTSDPAKAIR